MLSGMGEDRRQPSGKASWKRLDRIRSRNNVSRVSNKRLKLNFVEFADTPPPLASSIHAEMNFEFTRSFFDRNTSEEEGGFSTGSGGTQEDSEATFLFAVLSFSLSSA